MFSSFIRAEPKTLGGDLLCKVPCPPAEDPETWCSPNPPFYKRFVVVCLAARNYFAVQIIPIDLT